MWRTYYKVRQVLQSATEQGVYNMETTITLNILSVKFS